MKINLQTLEIVTSKLLEQFESQGITEIDLDHDYYWNIYKDDIYNLKRRPKVEGLGQLAEELKDLELIAQGKKRCVVSMHNIYQLFIGTFLLRNPTKIHKESLPHYGQSYLRHWMMHLTELKKRIKDDGPFVWIEPNSIIGVNLDDVLHRNRERWLNKYTPDDQIETEDEIIVDYLWDCLMEQKNTKQIQSDIKKINSIDLVNAVIFLIQSMGSSYAASLLVVFRDLLSQEEIQECITALEQAFKNSKEFQSYVMKSFILDFFRYDSGRCDLALEISDANKEFLDYVSRY